jgi:hypothetical protein
MGLDPMFAEIGGRPSTCRMSGVVSMTGTEPHAGETSLIDTITYVGLDVHKATVSVAVAESGRGGELCQVGVFANRPEVLAKLAARLSKGGRRLSFCYEAGPCGGLHQAELPASHLGVDLQRMTHRRSGRDLNLWSLFEIRSARVGYNDQELA